MTRCVAARRLVVLALACPVLLAVSVFLGEGWQNPADLLSDGNAAILEVRIWRVAVGAIVGSALAVAGAMLQAVLRNPLAEPFVLGVSSGAGLGAAACIVLGGLAMGVMLLPAAAFLGGLLSLLIVYRLSRSGSVSSPSTLVLAGVVWASLCGSALMFLLSQSSAEGLHAVMWWFLGDLQVYDRTLVLVSGSIIMLTLAGSWFSTKALNLIVLGDDDAGHTGVDPESTRKIVFVISSVLTAAAVSVSGIIGFVGLAVPHAMRALVGSPHQRLLPACALAGAVFVVLADGIGRMLLYPIEIPVGVLTSLVGAPWFLFILRRKQKEIWSR